MSNNEYFNGDGVIIMNRARYNGIDKNKANDLFYSRDALEHLDNTNEKGYIYLCDICQKPARYHRPGNDEEGHFEHEDRDFKNPCPLGR